MSTSQLVSLANTLKSLANPKRLEILELLQNQKLCVGTLQSKLNISQANLSQHLSLLRDIGVLSTNRNGRYVYYQVSDSRLIKACNLVRDFLTDQTLNHTSQSNL